MIRLLFATGLYYLLVGEVDCLIFNNFLGRDFFNNLNIKTMKTFKEETKTLNMLYDEREKILNRFRDVVDWVLLRNMTSELSDANRRLINQRKIINKFQK